MSESRKFHLGDVLSVLSKRALSLSGSEGFFNLLNFMTQDLALNGMANLPACQAELLRLFPILNSPALDHSIDEYLDSLAVDPHRDSAEDKKMLEQWLAVQVSLYGEMFEVAPLVETLILHGND